MKAKIMRLLLKVLGVLAILAGAAAVIRREPVIVPWPVETMNSVLLGILLLGAEYNEN